MQTSARDICYQLMHLNQLWRSQKMAGLIHG
jgi:hypothetical protein